MFVQMQDITLNSTTGAAATTYTGHINGRVLSISIQYASAATTGFATTAALTVVTEVTRQAVWTETLTTLATTTVNLHRVPRQVVHTPAGVALTATEGYVREPFYVGNERLVVDAATVGSGTKQALIRIMTG